MAPPRRDIPWVKRSIGFLPTDVEMLEVVRSRLGEPDGSAAIRRLIRDAFNGAQATHLPAKPVKPASEARKHPFSTTFAKAVVAAVEKPASEPEKRPSVALKSRPGFNPQPKTGKKR